MAGVLGILVQIVMGELHPSMAQPNDSEAAFREYARSDIWTLVHIGQFFGVVLVVVALLALARSSASQPGSAGALAVLGAGAAVVTVSVFAVQMAVDGVALKAAIQGWVTATGSADQATAFHLADTVRSVEKGLGGFFQMVNGATLLALGLSLVLGRIYARWLGWTGAVAGVGWLVGGVITAHTGFSAQASTVLLAPLLLTVVFTLGACLAMWRKSTTAA